MGDGDTDVIVALKGGFYQLSALWGYRSFEELKSAGAVNFVKTPLQLYDIFGIEKSKAIFTAYSILSNKIISLRVYYRGKYAFV